MQVIKNSAIRLCWGRRNTSRLPTLLQPTPEYGLPPPWPTPPLPGYGAEGPSLPPMYDNPAMLPLSLQMYQQAGLGSSYPPQLPQYGGQVLVPSRKCMSGGVSLSFVLASAYNERRVPQTLGGFCPSLRLLPWTYENGKLHAARPLEKLPIAGGQLARVHARRAGQLAGAGTGRTAAVCVRGPEGVCRATAKSAGYV